MAASDEEEQAMGFMDKAKKLAEQAQEKVDEVQQQFNDSQAQGGAGGDRPTQRFDAHGRPIADTAPVEQPPAGGADPSALDSAPDEPAAPSASEPVVPARPPAADGVEDNPDPFRPIQ